MNTSDIDLGRKNVSKNIYMKGQRNMNSLLRISLSTDSWFPKIYLWVMRSYNRDGSGVHRRTAPGVLKTRKSNLAYDQHAVIDL